MLQSWRSGYWKLGLGISLALAGASIAASGNCALAQIVRDSTLGDDSSVITPGSTVDEITGGATRGANLFHSFEQFSVLTGRTAYFNNALAVQNILSRVTGGSVSNIDGLIKANGNANLFLLNPNGIIFGPNATLNIGGSFLASTANSLRFEDGTGFSAKAPETRPLLTVSAPIGLQFGGGEGTIFNQSVAAGSISSSILPVPVGLQVKPGKTLALVGGDVELAGSYLTAEAGRIELGSVAGPSLVRLNPADQGWALGYEGVQNFRDIRLSDGAVVNASGDVGGNIQVQGKSVTLTDGSQIVAFTTGSGPGGTLSVNASDSVELVGTTPNGQVSSSLRTDTVGIGKAGDLRINTKNLLVQSRAFVSSTTFAQGQGGDLVVTASGFVELDRGVIYVSSQQRGNAGSLEVTARSIRLYNQAALRAESLSGGNDGNITLQVQDLLLLRGGSQISTDAGTAGTGGNGGNITTIGTPFIIAVPSENSDIRARASGSGGNAQITAQGLFGTQFQLQPTPESDITATGEFELNTPTVFDPRNGLVTLPAELVDVAGLIVQGCPGGGGTVGTRASEFIVIGRGGLPPNPREALGSEPALADLGTPVQGQENRTSAATSINPTSSEAAPLVEAQGWMIGSNGEVVLTAQAPSVTPHSPWLTPNNCHGS